MTNFNFFQLYKQVFYGQVIYIVTKSKVLDNKTKSALWDRMQSFNLDNSIELDDLKGYSIHLYVMGSGNDYIMSNRLEKMSDANKILSKYGKFGPNNMGYPMSYSIQDLQGRRVSVRNVAQFAKTTKIVFPPGLIHLRHTGAFEAYFNVSWDEISYDETGKMVRKHKTWEHNYETLTANFEEEISLTGNCRNISVSAAENNGFYWSPIFSFHGIELVDERTFKIGGTTLHAWKKIIPELD